jgi:hypothetical protein
MAIRELSELDWKNLPYSARMALLRIAGLLESGFTGQIAIECGQGGVRSLTYGRRETADDMEEVFNGRGAA